MMSLSVAGGQNPNPGSITVMSGAPGTTTATQLNTHLHTTPQVDRQIDSAGSITVMSGAPGTTTAILICAENFAPGLQGTKFLRATGLTLRPKIQI